MPAPGTPKIFQPALPMRGVTSRGEPRPLHVIISTRTPHAGSDGRTIDDVRAVVEFQPALPMRGVTSPPGCTWRWRPYFNPHSPCGEGRERALKLDPGNVFQPALPMRGVTIVTNDGYTGELISTRTPHAGSDPMRPVVSVTNSFQPALPMRGVTVIKMRLFKFV